MIVLRVEHANAVWDRHIVVSADQDSTQAISIIFSWLETTIKDKPDVKCYGFTHLHQPDCVMFAGTVFGLSKDLMSLVKDLEKQINQHNETVKRKKKQ